MTPQEMQALQGFLAQLTQAQAGAKDEQADALIADAVRRQPDAAYLLVQRALLLDHALVSARAQIATLQSQLQAAQGGAHDASFLNGGNTWGNAGNPASAGVGGNGGNGWNGGNGGNTGNAAGYNTGPSTAPASYPTQMQAPVQAQAPMPPAAPPQRSGWLGDGARSTLGSIATTAAGVAGGAFLFQGIESLFHRNGGGFFGGQPALGSGMMPSETIINNTVYENGNGGFNDGLNGSGSGNGNGFLDTSNSDFSDIDGGLMDSGGFDDDSNLI